MNETASHHHQRPVIFGEVLFDCFEDGSRVLGGAPFNVAWHLQAFGQAPLFISRIGDDAMGREILDTMRDWGVTTDGLQMDPEHATGEVSIRLQAGQPSFDILADRAYDHIDATALPGLQPSLIYHGSLALRQPDSAAALTRLLQQHPAPVFIDVNLRAPWWQKDRVIDLINQASWVKINDQELEQLSDTPGDLQHKAQQMLEDHGLQWIIVTLGADGAFALNQDRQLVEVAPSATATVIDTVGAGDAFASVCINGLLNDWPLALTLQRAQQFASILVTQRGATLHDAGIYRQLLATWQTTDRQ